MQPALGYSLSAVFGVASLGKAGRVVGMVAWQARTAGTPGPVQAVKRAAAPRQCRVVRAASA